MITKKTYIEYLLSTPINYTCSNLSEHLENVSHDTVTDFLQNSKFRPRDLWDLVKDRIDDSEDAFLLVDDSVQNKQHSHVIETVKLQYSGNVHGLVKGIGLVNLVHTNGFEGDFNAIDYRVYDPDSDDKTKRLRHIFERCLYKPINRSESRHARLVSIRGMQGLII